jgi:uncharacterized protein YabE (DUF348 family)
MNSDALLAHWRWIRWLVVAAVALFLVLWSVKAPQPLHAENERVITIYHDGIEETVVTDAPSIEEVLKRIDIALNKNDVVEPALKTELIAPSYYVNVYRARPVTVVDGQERHEIVSAHTSARKIAADAGIKVHDEDSYRLTRINDFVADGGVGLKLTIQRATPITLDLYGKTVAIRTHATTVGMLLKEKGIELGADEGVSVPLRTPIVSRMIVQVWRNGVQTITQEQATDFPVKQIHDADRPYGFKEVQTPGVKGKRMVTYQIEMRNGIEVARKEIQSVIIAQPKEQVEIVGAKPSGGGLTKSKGVNYFVDSRGVGHRETYYDLRMGGVMSNRVCPGTYSVRADGAKIDQDGYVIVAANLDRYPRCSVVETSLGLGKVYDTGGFAAVHPDGFDLATDWSNNNGE